MLKNEYLVEKFGFDTEETEPLKVLGGDSIHYSILSLLAGSGPRTRESRRLSLHLLRGLRVTPGAADAPHHRGARR